MICIDINHQIGQDVFTDQVILPELLDSLCYTSNLVVEPQATLGDLISTGSSARTGRYDTLQESHTRSESTKRVVPFLWVLTGS